MAALPYRFEPFPGYDQYKITSMLKDYLGILMEHPEKQETIEQILKLINGYRDQLKNTKPGRNNQTSL
jgi:hypothetical protein